MKLTSLQERVINQVKLWTGEDVVTLDNTFEDFECDSLDIAETIIGIEAEFEIAFSNAEFEAYVVEDSMSVLRLCTLVQNKVEVGGL